MANVFVSASEIIGCKKILKNIKIKYILFLHSK